MNLLFLTNLFPPLSNGGYEQWCQETALGLIARGHRVTVLTSRHGRERLAAGEPAWVRRELYFEMAFGTRNHSLAFFTRRQADEAANLACLEAVSEEVRPDAVVVWGMWNLHRSLAARAEALFPGRVLYYFGDYWPELPSQHRLFWDAPARSWTTRIPKSLLKPAARWALRRDGQPDLKLEWGLFPSRFLQAEFERRGIRVGCPAVVTGGVETARYSDPGLPGRRPRSGGFSLLAAGRLSPEKGLETAIDAMGELLRRGTRGVRLVITGSGERGYVAGLQAAVQRSGLEQAVEFRPPVPKEAMPLLYREFDGFLFPSLWEEPFGRVLVEAMASGLVVTGTATGGAAEILEHEVSGLVFPPGDAAALADAIQRLLDEPGLADRLADAGRELALSRFTIEKMVAGIEDALYNLQG